MYLEAPPNAALKDAFSRGMVPKSLYDAFPQERCLCGHAKTVHAVSALFPWGECGAKKCPCFDFRQDPAYLLPAYGSKPLAEVSEVTPLPERPK